MANPPVLSGPPEFSHQAQETKRLQNDSCRPSGVSHVIGHGTAGRAAAVGVGLESPYSYGSGHPTEGGAGMMQFTEQIQRAFAETVRSGVLPDIDRLPDRLRDFTSEGPVLDTLWADLLHGYQDGPRQAWATVLLEAMRPDLAEAVAIVPAFPPVVTREDYAQQLMANLLTAALVGPAEQARWTPNRLISHASRDTQRWLAREIRGHAKRVGYVDRKAAGSAAEADRAYASHRSRDEAEPIGWIGRPLPARGARRFAGGARDRVRPQ